MQLLVIQFTIKMFHIGFMQVLIFKDFIILIFRLQYEDLHKTYVKHLNCKLYYQQLHLKYLCNLARY